MVVILSIFHPFSSCSTERQPSPKPQDRAFDQEIKLPLHKGADQNIPQRFPRYGPHEDWVVSGWFQHDKDESNAHFWVVHPPIAFIRDVVGEEKFGRCVEALRAGTATMCWMREGENFPYWIRMTKTGYAEMHIFPPHFRKQFDSADFELSNAEIYPSPDQFIPEP